MEAQDTAAQAWLVVVRLFWGGTARRSRLGMVGNEWNGGAWQCRPGVETRGKDRNGWFGFGNAGMEWKGVE